MNACRLAVAALAVTLISVEGRMSAQQAKPAPATSNMAAVEKLGQGRLRIGQIVVDTTRREAIVSGTVNEVSFLEWVANTRNGAKAYESAITIDTDAVTFNTAMLLIGLDPANARHPERHFDPNPPQGDLVDIQIEYSRGGEKTRVPVEQILVDKESGKTMPSEGWVYTGSSFRFDGLFAAEIDGTLIGFVHSPSPIIEQVGTGAINRFGQIGLHPDLKPSTTVTLTFRNLGKTSR
jgi:hypothetical protein